MDESYTSLPTSHLLGSVPAVISDEKKTEYTIPEAKLQIFPPNTGADRGKGYQIPGSPSGRDEEQATNSWKGVFNISSYTQYFNVDTDVVLDRIKSSFYPIHGDFFRKIDDNPDLYGLTWISATLVFVMAAFGNCATYLMQKSSNSNTTWSFDVSYISVASGAIYGYTLVVPTAFYFLLHYLGSNASLVRFWCMWGYSLFIFVCCSFLMIIPVDLVRWMVIIIAGVASACFVAFNIKSYIGGSDLNLVVVASFVLQLALALFIKIWMESREGGSCFVSHGLHSQLYPSADGDAKKWIGKGWDGNVQIG
ncbi:Yip1 domain [Macleaya cordata]|uniref:Protein YIP n=1 Tax=Macleaya cordata TaxID=56857 RepID=A0A200R4Z7_MACCD|nr:Yip1 domain [Macleaya cordata]